MNVCNYKEINAFFASAYQRGGSCPSCTNRAKFSHRFHRCSQIRRVWHPAIPTQPLNYLPTEPYAA